ncbi:MAG TPA: YicC family protein [Clostridiales bacterium]|nr:YicC family protein [Clostridiales bacterium]
MLRSMTGYGRGEGRTTGHRAVAEVRSVNHRFFDLSLRLPRGYGGLEERVRAAVQEQLTRGRVELSLTVERLAGGDGQVRVDADLAERYHEMLLQLGRRLALSDPPRLDTILTLPGVMAGGPQDEDLEAVYPAVHEAVTEGVGQLAAMRRREGDRLCRDLAHRLSRLGQLMEEVSVAVPRALEEGRARLTERLNAFGGGMELDAARLTTEVALAAERCDITEELVRVGSHLHEAGRTLTAGGPAGRRLDFLSQEIGRELNTAASKTGDLPISRLLLDAREELEKVREQVQNLE